MGSGKKRIKIMKIDDKSKRLVAFSKRRQGLIQKANQLRRRTGVRFAVVVFSPAENIYRDGDLTLIDRYSSTMQTNCDVIVVEDDIGEDMLSLFTKSRVSTEEIESLDELICRRDSLGELVQMLMAQQSNEDHQQHEINCSSSSNQDRVHLIAAEGSNTEAELQHVDYIHYPDRFSHRLANTESYTPLKEIQFFFGSEKEPISATWDDSELNKDLQSQHR